VPCSELSAARGTFVSSGFDPWSWLGGFGDNGESDDWFSALGWSGGLLANSQGSDGWGFGGLFGSGGVQTAEEIKYRCEVRKEGWLKKSYYCVPSQSFYSFNSSSCHGGGWVSEVKVDADNFEDCQSSCNKKNFEPSCG
jgi:hypothetical protein